MATYQIEDSSVVILLEELVLALLLLVSDDLWLSSQSSSSLVLSHVVQSLNFISLLLNPATNPVTPALALAMI